MGQSRQNSRLSGTRMVEYTTGVNVSAQAIRLLLVVQLHFVIDCLCA